MRTSPFESPALGQHVSCWFALALALSLACGSDTGRDAPDTPSPGDLGGAGTGAIAAGDPLAAGGTAALPVAPGDDGPGDESPGDEGAAGQPGDDEPARGAVWFRDDFESATTASWDLTPGEGAAFAVVLEPGTENHVLAYTAGSESEALVALVTDAAWAGAEAAAGAAPLADYYVQARLKPQHAGAATDGRLFLLARYQDANNGYLGGLDLQPDPAATRVQAGALAASAFSAAVEQPREILQGAAGQADGQWYSVRLELVGQTLTVYLDGAPVGSAVDAAFAQGKVGLFSTGGSFLVDDVIVGDAAVKPVSLVLEPPQLLRTAEAAAPPLQVDVRALAGDGVTTDGFSAVSDTPAVASVAIDGTRVSLTPVSPGIAHVTFTSGSEPTLYKVLTLTVTAPGGDGPGGLGSVTQPPAGQQGVPVDAPLALTFDSPPTLGAGSVRIVRSSDGSTVDSVAIGAGTDVLGPPSGTSTGRVRTVNTRPISVEGNRVFIKPHSRVLEYGTEYSVVIPDGVIRGNLAGEPFTGIAADAGWRFSTRAAAPTGANVTVDDDGTTADFRTIQGALDHVMQNVAANTAATIRINDGTYRELLFERGKNNLTITGQSRDGVVVRYENFEGFNGGTGSSTATPGNTASGGRSLFLIEGSDLLTLDNFTLLNVHRRTGTGDQAETIYFNTDQGRLVATGMRFASEQDTLQLKGFSWFFDSLVEGNVDFIWGNNRVALFENSEIRSLGDSRSASASGGYVLQARTVAATDKGFVFSNSTFTQAPGPAGTAVARGATYLARSGGSTGYFDNVTLVNCRLDTHIANLGWAEEGVNGQPAPNPATASAASGWREFGSQNLAGAPLSLAGRSDAARVLTANEVAAGFSSRAQIFAAFGNGAGWNPAP